MGSRGRAAGFVVIAVCAAMCWALPLCRAQAVNSHESGGGSALSSGSALPSSGSGDYVIGSDDVLAVNVWREDEISREVPVRPDGKVSLPLIGDVEASGLTPSQLQRSIHDRLAVYLVNPAVTVMVKEARSHRFNVVGEVEHPGSFVLGQPLTVLDALALAGGFRDFAKTSGIYVLRQHADGSHQRFPFNYKLVISGRSLGQNIHLQPGDTVVVP
ncbi:MAG TPA: polysaccharide biosynthesis/export family protein [Terriglobales bacterium]|nr:polysaccharide biosynthesis/export family protein [Terriglobales bacterium]